MPTEKFQRRCVRCETPAPNGYAAFCKCGGLIDVFYDLNSVTLVDADNAIERYINLLPIEDAAAWRAPELTRTPCVHAKAIGRLLGMPRLYLKDESVLPTGSTKDRMAAVALPYLYESGVRAFSTSSTGNSSTSFAHAIGRAEDARLFLFTAESFVTRVDCPAGAPVVHFVLENATFVDAFNCAGTFATRTGVTAERGFFNPGRREGLKLAFLEAVEQVPGTIDWYVQAVSSAMGVYGTCKGARELRALGRIERTPRLLCVQQETCAPMVHAYVEGSETIEPRHVVARPTGIATAILRGDPTRAYPYVREMVVESRGSFVAVTEADIREARKMLEELEGLRICFNAAAALAGLIRQVRDGAFPVADTVLVNLTGRDRAPGRPHRQHRLHKVSNEWRPVESADEVTWRVWGDPLGEAPEAFAGASA